MRRTLTALAAIATFVFLASATRAQETPTKDDWKWDPRKKATPKVGDKKFYESEQAAKEAQKTSMGGQVLEEKSSDKTVSHRSVHEVIATDGKAVTEELIKIEKWKLVQKDEEPDTSLEGHTIRVKGKGADKKLTIEDDKDGKVSADAKAWAEGEFAKKKKNRKAADDDEDEKGDKGEKGKEKEKEKAEEADDADLPFLPGEPVAPDSEWTVDVKKVGKELLGEGQYDPEKSSGKGTLKGVRVVDGVHYGKYEIKISLALKTPMVVWKKGGIMEITFAGEGSLDSDKKDSGDGTMSVTFADSAEVASPQGAVKIKVSSEVKGTMKRGPLEDKK